MSLHKVKEMVKNLKQLPPKEESEFHRQRTHQLYGIHTEKLQNIAKRSINGQKSEKERMKHIESFIASNLNETILHKCRTGMFCTILK